MDSEEAWANFKKSKTSLDDKIDVLLAENEEMRVDIERVSELAPQILGDKAEEDANKELAEEEGASPAGGDPLSFLDGFDMESDNGEGVADEANPDAMGDEAESFDDTKDDVEEEDAVSAEEGTPVEEDVPAEESEESPNGIPANTDETAQEEDVNGEAENNEVAEEKPEGVPEEEAEAKPEEESKDIPEAEPEEKPEEKPTEDIVQEKDEDKEKTFKSFHNRRVVAKSKVPLPVIKSRESVMVKSMPPSASIAGVSTQSALVDGIFKSVDNNEPMEIGWGHNPHDVCAKDWERYKLFKQLNQF